MDNTDLPALRPADKAYEEALQRLKERDVMERDLLGRIVAAHAERLDNQQDEILRLRNFVHETRTSLQAVITGNGAMLVQQEKILAKLADVDKTAAKQETHEQVCSERQKAIAAHMEDSKKERNEIKNDLKNLLRSVLAGSIGIIAVLLIMYVLPGKTP